MAERILVVDDEKEIADLIELYLTNEGYEVIKCYNGTDALDAIENEDIDLALLDVMLPDLDGFYLCKRIREHFFYPVIMLTAKVEDTDKITGLTIGADDYITKPFSPLEVIARVKTQLRRYKRYNNPEGFQSAEKTEYDIRGLVINSNSHKVFLYGKEISLTPREFAILWYLCRNKGKVISTEQLYEAVWEEDYLPGSKNTIMAHITRIREKLNEPAKNPKFVKTVWGVGYKVE